MTHEDAIRLLREAGYRVTKPKAPKLARGCFVTFECRFADGEVTRMTHYARDPAALPGDRAMRVAAEAWRLRVGVRAKRAHAVALEAWRVACEAADAVAVAWPPAPCPAAVGEVPAVLSGEWA